MKFDMHCHVKEGSIDSKVSLDEYITILKKHGFGGMLVTDHDTYKGYRHWKYDMKGKVHNDFVVLKGIEYDTRDAGHILIIMPEGVRMRLLELRGLPVSVLIDFVHRHGEITCETDLISQIRRKVPLEAGGSFYTKTTKDKMGKANKLLVYSFWFYNKGGELLKRRRRNEKSRIENPIDPIDPIEAPYVNIISKK